MLYSIGLKYLPGLNFNKRLTYDNAKFERQIVCLIYLMYLKCVLSKTAELFLFFSVTLRYFYIILTIFANKIRFKF